MKLYQGILFALLAVVTVTSAFNPGSLLKPFTTTEQRIKAHGYPAESHFVETSDGYVLNLFRIPYSHKLQNQNLRRPAILLQHGLFSNSDCWITSGPDHSLAYLLADAGYDVWMGNARANIYSRHNTKISINHPYFWRFDWHEIGVIDIAAMIDYIIAQTGEQSIHYAGHSQGTTVYFVLMSERPEYNAKVKSAHMLAPCAFFGHGSSFIFKVFQPLVGKPNTIYNAALEDIELLPQNALINRLMDTTCGPNPALGTALCKNMYLWMVGDGYQNVNMTSMQILIETHAGGSSSNQGIHYIQLYDQKEQFRQYDWGTKKNEKKYGQKTPPNYDLSKITAPTFTYAAVNDALCDPADVDKLLLNMPQYEEHYVIPDPTFNHLDFIVANHMKEMLNDRILNNLNKYESL